MLTKMVNGERVNCSPAEEAEIQAGWTENNRPRTPQEISAEKDERIKAEFTPNVLLALEVLIPLIDPTLNITSVINQAKAKRKTEL